MEPVNKDRLSFLVLDYNRPVELRKTLSSIRERVKISDYQIIVHANGGEQSYHIEYYKQGLIDKLILNKWNNGAGYGCSDLFNYCNTEWAFYLEGDQLFIRDFTDEELAKWKKSFNSPKVKFISPVGLATGGQFTQRAFFTNVPFYKELAKNMPNGGPGYYKDRDTNEHFVQVYIEQNDLILVTPATLCIDLGCYSVNENPDGSVWLHRTDTRAVALVRGPVKEKWNYPNFSDQEWENVILGEFWEDFKIPEKDKPHSFIFWKDSNDAETLESLKNEFT